MKTVRAALLLGLCLAAGCASNERRLGLSAVPTQPAAKGGAVLVENLPQPAPDIGGALAPGDVLDVQVFGVSELNRTVEVDEAGQVSLALIGPVQAGGRSVHEVERAVEAAYGRDYLQSPRVSVLLKDGSSRRVAVDGAVKRAGVFPAAASATLLAALAQAEGLSPVADARKVVVFRQIGATRYAAAYDVTAIRRGAAPDIAIRGGDTVVVPDSASRQARQDLKDILGMAGSVGSFAAFGL